jgi:tetratricopeptide (TPR) repeat protein
MKSEWILALLTVSGIAAGAQDAPSCPDRNEAAMAQASSGVLAGAGPAGDACAGLILGNMARALSISGRTAEAERLAEQSVRILEKFYPPNDWTLLRPLQILAATRLESGKTARAREAVERIQSIRIQYPEDAAIIHTTAGALLQIEGRRSEAEAEYHAALRAWEETGRGESADAAAILYCLGSLYLEERRMEEASLLLDRALVINDRAKDSSPADRIKFLRLRSVLHARLGEWQQAEQDLRDTFSIVDRQPYVDPALLRSLLDSYSYVLRRNHHPREARSIDARRAALPPNQTTTVVVDMTELLVEKKPAKKESTR